MGKEYEKINFEFSKHPLPYWFAKITIDRKRSFPRHSHQNFCEFILLKEGKGKVIIEGKPYAIDENSVVVFHPGVTHEEFYEPVNGDSELFYFTITDYIFNGEKNSALLPPGCPPHLQLCGEKLEHLYGLVLRAIEEMQQKKVGYDNLATLLCMEISIKILRLFDEKYNLFIPAEASDKTNLVMKIKLFLENNYSNTDLTIKSLEKEFFLSQYYNK